MINITAKLFKLNLHHFSYNFNNADWAPLAGVMFVVLSVLLIRVSFRRPLKPTASDIAFQDKEILQARYMPNRSLPVFIIVLLLIGFGFWQSFVLYSGYNFPFKVFYICFAVFIILQMILALSNKPVQALKEDTVSKKLAVLVPVYNEDPRSLKDCLNSILGQSKLPDEIHVVDDGSESNYRNIKKDSMDRAKNLGIHMTWKKQNNQGKRIAHITAFNSVKDKSSDLIIATVDSDGTLDPSAFEEGVKPFNIPEVNSVAGIAVNKYVSTNLLTRLTDMVFVGMFQLIDRSSMSRLGSILVNTGSLAYYRYDVMVDAIENGYGEETFMSKKVTFSDDSFLTLFALLKGRVVQQPSSIVFADMPINFHHHVRQQMRWMRGSFIRSIWRLKLLKIFSWAYLRQLLGWLLLATSTIILVYFFFYRTIAEHLAPPLAFWIVLLAMSFMQSARYFAVSRNDFSTSSQFVSFCLTPLASLYSMIVLRAFRIYGMITPFKTQWGTRDKIETTPTNR